MKAGQGNDKKMHRVGRSWDCFANEAGRGGHGRLSRGGWSIAKRLPIPGAQSVPVAAPSNLLGARAVVAILVKGQKKHMKLYTHAHHVTLA